MENVLRCLYLVGPDTERALAPKMVYFFVLAALLIASPSASSNNGADIVLTKTDLISSVDPGIHVKHGRPKKIEGVSGTEIHWMLLIQYWNNVLPKQCVRD